MLRNRNIYNSLVDYFRIMRRGSRNSNKFTVRMHYFPLFSYTKIKSFWDEVVEQFNTNIQNAIWQSTPYKTKSHNSLGRQKSNRSSWSIYLAEVFKQYLAENSANVENRTLDYVEAPYQLDSKIDKVLQTARDGTIKENRIRGRA